MDLMFSAQNNLEKIVRTYEDISKNTLIFIINKHIKIIICIGIAFSRIKLRNLSVNNATFLKVNVNYRKVKISRVIVIIFLIL